MPRLVKCFFVAGCACGTWASSCRWARLSPGLYRCDFAAPSSEAHQAAIYRAWRPPGELHWHQKMRIYTFLNPDFAPRINSWQAYQSFITVGSGGLSGKGFMNGTQTKLNYLPEHRTDFIFSHYAEERGFIGGVVIIASLWPLLMVMYARDCPK